MRPPLYDRLDTIPAARRAVELLEEHQTPEAAARHSLEAATMYQNANDWPQWEYWRDVATMVRVFAAIGWKPPE